MLDYRRESSYTPDFTAQSAELRESHRHAVPDRQAAAVGQRLLPAPDHRRSQRQYQRQLPDGDYGGPPIDCTAPPRAAPRSPYCAAGPECDLTPACSARPASALQLTDSADLFGWQEPGDPRRRLRGLATTRSPRPSSTAGSRADRTLLIYAEPLQQRDRHLAQRQQQDLRHLPDRHALAERAAAFHCSVRYNQQHRDA